MSYDPLLEEQLAQVGIHPDQLPTAEQYWELLDRVSATYAAPESRSSANEGLPLTDELLAALDEVLGSLARLTRTVPPNPEALDATRRQWVSRLHDVNELARHAHAADTADLAGSLGRSFEGLFEALATGLSAEAAGGALHRELTAATRLVLPDRDWLDVGTLSLAGASQPAGASSGDFWLAHRLGDSRILVVVGDVTGHGAPSMVIAAGARAACSVVAARAGANLSDFLEAMHRVVTDIGRGERMLTCAVALYDSTRRELSLANAGHRLPLHVKAAGETAPILARGAPLGAGPNVDVEVMKLPLGAGEAFVLYSDGVVDMENDVGERFTERRLRTMLSDNVNADPRITRDKLLADLATFRGRRARTDDTTFVIARVPSIAGDPSPASSRRTS